MIYIDLTGESPPLGKDRAVNYLRAEGRLCGETFDWIMGGIDSLPPRNYDTGIFCCAYAMMFGWRYDDYGLAINYKLLMIREKLAELPFPIALWRRDDF